MGNWYYLAMDKEEEKYTESSASAFSKEAEAKEDISDASPASGESAEKSDVTGVGNWAFKHRKEFVDNPVGWYGIRNGVNAAVALAGLTTVIVPVRHGMKGIGKLINPTMEKSGARALASHPMLEMMVGVGLSFATFRTMFKVWKRNYDRIFTNAKNPEDSSHAIHDLPKNIWHDFKEIAPIEYPATTIAAVPLVAIRGGFGGGSQKSDLQDMIGSVPAYTLFFETTERVYRGFGKDESAVEGIFRHSEAKGPEDKPDHGKKAYATFTEDTPVRLLLRKVPAVALGIMPYIYLNRNMYKKQGGTEIPNEGGMKADDTMWQSWKKEIMPYEMFPAYTMLSEWWLNTYDGAFDRLQRKYDETQLVRDRDSLKNPVINTLTVAQAHEDASRDESATPTNRVESSGQLQADKLHPDHQAHLGA